MCSSWIPSDLRTSGGDYSTATEACPIDNETGTTVVVSGTPEPAAGDGYWYLVRGTNCKGKDPTTREVPGRSAPATTRSPGRAWIVRRRGKRLGSGAAGAATPIAIILGGRPCRPLGGFSGTSPHRGEIPGKPSVRLHRRLPDLDPVSLLPLLPDADADPPNPSVHLLPRESELIEPEP